MIFQAVPAYSLGTESRALLLNFFGGPGFAQAGLKSQEADADVLRAQLSEVLEHLRLNQGFSQAKVTNIQSAHRLH
jgi:hypothetical protein